MLLLLLWTVLFPPAAAAAPGAEATLPSASGNIPSCFVLINVAPDGELTVTERLKGFGPAIERPLSSFEKTYGSLAPFVQESDMELISAKADGKPVGSNMVLKEQNNRRIVRLEAQDKSLPLHEYILTYKARDRILFLADADKLDWDIWGRRRGDDTGPIDISCAIVLPEGAKVSKQWSRLGHETMGHKPVKQWINKKGVAYFYGEKPMEDEEHFVVSVEWNKGIVASDGSEKILATVKGSMWGLFAVLLILCSGLWYKFGKDPRPKATIPLFYPPTGPDGKTLSPAAVAYIREAAMLTSRGFSALLLNLAAQKIVDMKGTGSSKAPYILQTDGEILKRIPQEDKEEAAPNREPSSQQKRSIWKELLKLGRGFDLAEQLCMHSLFPNRPPKPLTMDKKNTWKMAVARSVSYAALSAKYRGMWVMNTSLVSLMFTLCYGGTVLVQGALWLNYGAANIDAVLAAVALSIVLTFVVHCTLKYMVNIYVRWQEMGWINLILLGIYALHLPVMLVYDAILGPGFASSADGNMSDFFLFPFMESTRTIRTFLWLGLMGYLLWLTRSIKEVFIVPLKVLGYLLLFLLAGGTVYVANQFMGSANLALMGSLLMPMFFMPLMKRPSQKGAALLAEIEGLALYLGTAEVSRLNVFNPPERSPEEFHQFMPYAVALGLEKAWGAQFSASLANMQFRGNSMQILTQYEHRMQGM